MDENAKLSTFVGQWSGTNRLWVMPGEPVRESATGASVTFAVRDAVMSITYTWTYEGTPQEGILLVHTAAEPEAVRVVWFDAWHTANKFMFFHNDDEKDGLVAVYGTYAAPPGPDWGWRIILDTDGADEFHILMYNITPDGREALAVETRYTRVGG